MVVNFAVTCSTFRLKALGSLLWWTLLLLALPACSSKTESPELESAAADSEVACEEPKNPWSDEEGGHDAGFKWAEETGGMCTDDHGQSFEEGCNEYYTQLERYEACQAPRKE